MPKASPIPRVRKKLVRNIFIFIIIIIIVVVVVVLTAGFSGTRRLALK